MAGYIVLGIMMAALRLCVVPGGADEPDGLRRLDAVCRRRPHRLGRNADRNGTDDADGQSAALFLRRFDARKVLGRPRCALCRSACSEMERPHF